jgi:hypothetical protein
MPEQLSTELHNRVQAILADANFDDEACLDTRAEAIRALVDTYGWAGVLQEMLALLQDDAAQRHWREASIVIWGGIDQPMPATQVIALLYRRLIEDVPVEYELDGNLVWSIARNLKGVDYLSDYDPMKDPEIIAEMARRR